jgi:hypothetical protein
MTHLFRRYDSNTPQDNVKDIPASLLSLSLAHTGASLLLTTTEDTPVDILVNARRTRAYRCRAGRRALLGRFPIHTPRYIFPADGEVARRTAAVILRLLEVEFLGKIAHRGIARATDIVGGASSFSGGSLGRGGLGRVSGEGEVGMQEHEADEKREQSQAAEEVYEEEGGGGDHGDLLRSRSCSIEDKCPKAA